VIRVLGPTEKGRQQSSASQTHHDSGVLEHEVAQVGVAPDLIKEWREVQGLGWMTGASHPGGIRRSALFRASAPAHNWAITALPGPWRSLNPNSLRGQNPLQQKGFILGSNHRLNY